MESWQFVWAVIVLCSVPSGVYLEQVEPTECMFDADGDYDCRHHNLTSVPENLPGNATLLFLDHNYLIILKNNELLNKGGVHFRTMHIRNNDIARLEDEAFSGLTNLKILSLGSNKITVFNKNIVSNNFNLEELLLESNPLELPSSENVSLINSSSLTTLSLSRCNLTRLTRGLFSETPNLTTLYLTFNGLTTVNWFALDHLRLITFDLEGNDISHVPFDPYMVRSLSELNNPLGNSPNISMQRVAFSTIDLTLNPLVCDCHNSLAIYAMRQRFGELFGNCKVEDTGAALEVDQTGGLVYLRQCYERFLEAEGIK